MKFVLDCSVTMAWCFEDEANLYTQRILSSFPEGHEAYVPKLWQLEVVNVLLVAIRKKRILHVTANRFKQLILNLPIYQDIQGEEHVLTTVFEMACELQLSAYDAMYLELAFRENMPLATQDKALIRAASHIGVKQLSGDDLYD